MNDADARKLLIDAGIPEADIDHNAINLASTIGDAIAAAFARRIAKRVIETFLPLLNDEAKMRAKFAELGITFDKKSVGDGLAICYTSRRWSNRR